MRTHLLVSSMVFCLGVVLLGCPPENAPKAGFRSNLTQGTAPLEVRFTDESVPGKSPITAWLWLFGDGASSTEQDPDHTYTAEGSYTVSLTVTTDQGEDTKLVFNCITVSGEGEGEGEFPVGEMVSVPAGTFTMGRTDDGDDRLLGQANELPRHEVTLSAYEIGKYDVTVQEYVEFLNWALAEGLLENKVGLPYTGGEVYRDGKSILCMNYDQGFTGGIIFSGISFTPAVVTGLPEDTLYSTALHPVSQVSWYGAVYYCNWLSAKNGLTSCYDTETWALNRAANGYHLPTEAQWERAAAWDAALEKHWIYGFMSDTCMGWNRCNITDYFGGTGCVNPLGLVDEPYTSPVGWFNGINISPNGNIQTLDSPSPVGCYDMCGNVWQWCNDWYAPYSSEPPNNPTGPTTGSQRVVRGGSWHYYDYDYRAAQRLHWEPQATCGFRLARY